MQFVANFVRFLLFFEGNCFIFINEQIRVKCEGVLKFVDFLLAAISVVDWLSFFK